MEATQETSAPPPITEAKVRRIRYECAQCGAEDFNKLFPSEAAAPCFNCWSCGAGRGIHDLSEQVARQQGMFPTYEVDDDNKRIEEPAA
jgi:hypothetical protein